MSAELKGILDEVPVDETEEFTGLAMVKPDVAATVGALTYDTRKRCADNKANSQVVFDSSRRSPINNSDHGGVHWVFDNMGPSSFATEGYGFED